MDKKIRWGILSCARIARDRTIPAILQAENAELYAVAGKDPARLESFRSFGPAVLYNNYEALLENPAVDAVYICLPNHLHKEWAIKALQHGKHVFCEKPLALTAADTEEMFRAAEENGRLLVEAYAYLHGDIVNTVHAVVDSGALGQVKHVRVRYAFKPLLTRDIRFEPACGGGCTYDLGCYCLSFIRDLLGEEPCTVTANLYRADPAGVDLHADYLLTFPGGATASAFASFDSCTDSVREVIGSDGVLTIPAAYHFFGDTELVLKTAEGTRTIPVHCRNHYISEIEEFGTCILTGKTPRVSRAHSLGNARVLDRILQG